MTLVSTPIGVASWLAMRRLQLASVLLTVLMLCVAGAAGTLTALALWRSDPLRPPWRRPRARAGGRAGEAADQEELAATALSRQQRRFDAALDAMPHALCLADGEGRLIACNEPYRSLFGLGDADLQGAVVSEALLAAAARSRLGEALVRVLAAEQASFGPVGEVRASLHQDAAGGVLKAGLRPVAESGWLAIYEDVTDQSQSTARIAFMTRHDELTGLANRAQFQQRLQSRLQRAPAAGIAVLLVNIDFFKDINDLHGHAAGDAVLRMVAERLRASVRENDLVARLSGDEFAVLQQASPQPEAAAHLAARLVATLGEPYEVGVHRSMVTASVGVALGEPGSAAEPLFTRASAALRQVKAAGRAGYAVFEPQMDAASHERRLLANDLRGALAGSQFELYYQPIQDLQTRAVTSVETLLRWHHPIRGMVPPGVFIPMAEELGLIAAIGDWVLRRACCDATQWPETIKLAVNLSPLQFKAADLAEQVAAALQEAGLPAGRLELEITESVLLQDDLRVIETLRRLHLIGVAIVLDDFGTGYSSLSYLRRFSVDKIKIDRSFVSGLGEETQCRSIVASVIGLAQRLGVRTTGEGIETEQQLDQLRDAGCTEGQGYHLGRPGSLQTLVAGLNRAGLAGGDSVRLADATAGFS